MTEKPCEQMTAAGYKPMTEKKWMLAHTLKDTDADTTEVAIVACQRCDDGTRREITQKA